MLGSLKFIVRHMSRYHLGEQKENPNSTNSIKWNTGNSFIWPLVFHLIPIVWLTELLRLFSRLPSNLTTPPCLFEIFV